MRIAIMQPYLFPYIGYFQLIEYVDKFVIFDDVQFIKRGWINRNNLLVNDAPKMFTFSVSKDSQEKNINERFYSEELFPIDKEKFLQTISHFYKKAPYFEEVLKLIEEILDNKNKNVSEFNSHSIIKISRYLGIETEFVYSSEIKKNNELKNEDKILDICKVLGATNYINPIGGTELYSKERFLKSGLQLNFIKTCNDISYNQFEHEFIPNLSIIDILMFNSIDEIKSLLKRFQLV